MSNPPFGPFPSNLTNAIQTNYLERAFINSLRPVLTYRRAADKEIFPGRIGSTITKTRMGLMVPNTTPLDPSTNTNLDNGLTPTQYSDEQYTLSIAQYPQLAPDINLPDNEVTIAQFAVRNAINLGIAVASAIDRLAQAQLFNAYMGGNTVVTATLGSPAATIAVDDVRGFQVKVVNGTVVPISTTNKLPVTVNGTTYNIQAFTVDGSNVSSAAASGGVSGTITADANISTTNGTLGNVVLSSVKPNVLRPNGRTSTAAIQAGDLLTMKVIRSAVAYLRNNAVPTVNGKYEIYLDATSMDQLFSDPEFQLLMSTRGTSDPIYMGLMVYETLDCRFITTTQAFIQTPQTGAPVAVAQTIHRPIVCGQGCLVESIFGKGLDAIRNMAEKGTISDVSGAMAFSNPFNINAMSTMGMMEGCNMLLRHPLDRLGQIISQTANYIGGFVVPTDVTTNPTVVGTSSNAYYKRAVVIETS